jgi:carbon storage regulator CsrA
MHFRRELIFIFERHIFCDPPRAHNSNQGKSTTLPASFFTEGITMLVLSRKRGEQVQIGDHVTITVLEVRGRKLTLGIQAPRGMRILRAELDSFDRPAPVVAGRGPRALQLIA